jgi:protein-tyrosine phosphatase
VPHKRPHQFIAAAFGIIGGLLVYWAADMGGWGWALLWPASNCLAVAAAYFTVSGKVFGKRMDGTLRSWVVLLMLPFLVINWTTWHAQVLLSSEPALHEIAPGLFLGRRVFDEEVPESVSLIVDMTAEFPRPDYRSELQYRTLPTLDAFVPATEAFVGLAREVAKHSGGVVVHCANGHGRSAALVAAVLLLRGVAKDVAASEEIIVAARPGCAWHPAQRALLLAVAGDLQTV